MKERIEQAREHWLHNREGDEYLHTGNALVDRTLLRSGFNAGAEWAFGEAGAIHAAEQDEWAVERAVGQRQLDDAAALMREAAELFRAYEAHHRGIAKRTGAKTGREEKADRNALAASRLEAWLAGKDRYPVSPTGDDTMVERAVEAIDEADRQTEDAQRQSRFINRDTNVRPVDSGHPLGDFEIVGGVMAALDGGAHSLSLADAAVFRLQTPDPRFDPAKPVLVNGYRYTPATEDLCKTN